MTKRKKKTDSRQLERFFMELAETAEAAMREYLRERGAEQEYYATEYVRRRGFLEGQ